ncbi:MAG: response regulator transcription factor [Fervidobacterium sp.]
MSHIKPKVVLVDDHVMFREALKSLLEQENIAEVIGEAGDGSEFLDLIDKVHPDVVLMDIDMPRMNGIEATQKAIEKKPELKILILSMFGDESYYKNLIIAGARGFILKTSGKRELENGILSVFHGDNFFSVDLLRKVLININSIKETNSLIEQLDLSDREMETLRLICNGYSNFEIAEKMFVSVKTVEFYKSKLLQKTNSKNTVNLVLFAIKNNLVSV